MITIEAAAKAVVVLGSGPAGVAVAEGLLAAGCPVLLVEGGDVRERDRDREMADGADPEGVWGHEPLGENRRRVVGGTSTAWGGRCIPLDPIDFEQREWVPNSGWPIPHEEYARWLPAAARLLEIPDTSFHRPADSPLLERGDVIDGTPIEVWSPPTDVSAIIARLESEAQGLVVLRNHHITGVEITAEGHAAALLGHRGDEPVRIVGERIVLAAGALENARLLLTSSIAGRLPAVGRYYMSHLFATHAAFSGPPLPKATDFFRIGHSYSRHRWQLTPEAQRRLRVGNVVGFMARPPAHGVAVHLDPLSALVGAAKLIRKRLRSPGALLTDRKQLAIYARVLLKAPPGFWPHVIGQSLRRGARYRLPMLLPPRSAAVHHLTVQAEHLPHPDSRVTLSDRTDRYGVPLLRAAIDFERSDFETVEAFHGAMADLLKRFGYRADRGARESSRGLARDMFSGFNSNAHHIGTTRMGTDPRTSVVDSDCRVHGVDNLFVAGSSVFPTSGHANPTLSIVALACRLASHLVRA